MLYFRAMKTQWIVSAAILYLLVGAALSAQTAQPTLAQLLDAAAQKIGPAPEKFPTIFLVTAVQPVVGDGCRLQLVTNGMQYDLFNQRQFGFCDHLPALNTAVWGRARHSKLAGVLNAGKPAGFPTEYVDLAYTLGSKPKAMAYKIETATAIGPDWGQ